MTVTFTLSSLYTGATYVAGPFNIFAVTNTGSSTQVATGVTKEQLAAGHVVSGISDATTGGTINSTGTCTNSYPWYVSTPEPTATEPTVYTWNCFEGTCIEVEGTGGTYGTEALCLGDCGNPCFIEGTNITLADGSQVLIETLQVGDVLKSFAIDTLPLYSDDDTVLTTWNTETLTGNQSTASIVSITPVQVSGIVVINNLLKTTPNHKHLVKHDGVWSFVSAYNVVVGDIMLDVNNNEVEVTSVETQQVVKTVYKMDVETLDVFYAENILTHNVKPPTSYFCKESEFAPCLEQASPCTYPQITCNQFEQPA
jgi:hypothetical protein